MSEEPPIREWRPPTIASQDLLVGVQTPVVPQPRQESKPPSEPPAASPVSKRVVFECRNGQWSTQVELVDKTHPFTNRDFNHMTTLLQTRRQNIRRQAEIEWRRLNQEQIKRNTDERIAREKAAEAQALLEEREQLKTLTETSNANG